MRRYLKRRNNRMLKGKFSHVRHNQTQVLRPYSQLGPAAVKDRGQKAYEKRVMYQGTLNARRLKKYQKKLQGLGFDIDSEFSGICKIKLKAAKARYRKVN